MKKGIIALRQPNLTFDCHKDNDIGYFYDYISVSKHTEKKRVSEISIVND